MQRESGANAVSEEEAAMREAVADVMREAGIEAIGDAEEGQRMLDEARREEVRMMSADSERRKKREEYLSNAADAYSYVYGVSKKEARKKFTDLERKRKAESAEVYKIILSGEYNDVSLQKINDLINGATPDNEFGRRVSERLPQGVERKMLALKRGDAIEVLYTRASESAVPANERTRPEGRRRIAEQKKKSLEQWAKATGNWHTDIHDFTNNDRLLDSDHDSDVYISNDGRHVIKLSRGKDDKRFKSDPDAVTLFNYLFRGSEYKVLGYGDFGKGFVSVLEQPYVDFSTSTPLTIDERVEYMGKMGFWPVNEDKTAFSNGTLLVADLQKSNIVRDANGEIRVIDADVKLHTKDMGGEYTYLPVEHDLPEKGGVRMQKAGAEQPMFFKTEEGEVYGFTVDGKVYYDPRVATKETMVHEYSHLWAEALKKANPKAWEHLKSELKKDAELLDYVKQKYPELAGNEDALIDEMFAHYSGRRGKD